MCGRKAADIGGCVLDLKKTIFVELVSKLEYTKHGNGRVLNTYNGRVQQKL